MTTTPGAGNYYANVEAYTHQYPFGMPQPGRTYDGSSLAYRYGFNGMETDPEVKGESGEHCMTYFRQYDPRVGRWWSNDPVVHPWESLCPQLESSVLIHEVHLTTIKNI
ncbi:MAG: hypothetical protein KDD67_07335 [Ignavibacteriae bacterium]|nr:hypothetical protein [Ignavibacteriota bacterium]MCB9217287.1 hypothetical protein [Ignavibacteria bacterium]